MSEPTNDVKWVNGASSESPPPSSEKHKPNCLQKLGSAVAGGLESFYFMLGRAIAQRPFMTVGFVLLGCGLCGIGMLRFYEVDPSDPIWVDPKSDVIKHKDWIDDKFPSKTRFNVWIIESDNILTPLAIQEMYRLHFLVTNSSVEGYPYRDLCVELRDVCWSSSLLELWKFDEPTIMNLTNDDIMDAVNSTSKSPVTSGPFDASSLLGGIKYGNDGRIISAKATQVSYFMQGTNASNTELVDEDKVTELVKEWEQIFIDTANNYNGGVFVDINVLSARSFGDEIGSSILGDVGKLSGGYILITLYVALILGRFNCTEMRVYLAISGVLGVGLSILVSFGLSSAFGIGYGPVQSILPFLLLGLGVDDVFVIVQAWNRLSATDRLLPLADRSGIALKHAGVSITVTSITDIVAFGIGATTVLPALKDFCIYAAIGILALFIIQATFFVGFVVIDERRRAARRNGCCCCYTHKDTYELNSCSQRDLQQKFFDKIYSPTIIKLPAKLAILFLSLGLLATGLYGVVNLEQDFDPYSFIPLDSYLREYVDAYDQYFPQEGLYSGYVYIGGVSFYKEKDKLKQMTQSFKDRPVVDTESVDFWMTSFSDWLATTKCPWVHTKINSTTKWPLTQENFNMMTSTYIYMTSQGRRHMRDVKFNGTLSLGGDEDGTNRTGGFASMSLNSTETLELEGNFSSIFIEFARIPFEFVDLSSSTERIEAMDNSRASVASYYSDDKSFPYSDSFVSWETDKIIQAELYRNMGLAFGCVVIITLLLIADIWCCVLVSVCVLSTLVEVGGFMYLWGLSIDTVTCIQLVLAIGLAVDYSAHIGHTFMTVAGTRNERTMQTMTDIGPAVFNGGFSTLLAFALLVVSNSYVFEVFFKVNLLVVTLGMWNGMLFLPVLLSWMGPLPYLTAQEEQYSPPEPAKPTDLIPNGKHNEAYDDREEKAIPKIGSSSQDVVMNEIQSDNQSDNLSRKISDELPNVE